MELGLDFLLHGHFLWRVRSSIIILLLILLGGLNGSHGIVILLHTITVLLEAFHPKYLILLGQVVIVVGLEVHESAALDEIVRAQAQQDGGGARGVLHGNL